MAQLSLCAGPLFQVELKMTIIPFYVHDSSTGYIIALKKQTKQVKTGRYTLKNSKYA